MKKGETVFAMGNEAMTAGALAAGALFFAGYPITPSSEIANLSSALLPQRGGLYIQMEDEISSIAAIIGASLAGKKAYTATSGPGFSLMQENLGIAVVGEVPCVIIDVMRSGPSTGMATKPAQSDLFQTQWGTHGDHGIIVLSPSSVQECYDYMITAFNLSEKYRTPVVFLSDAVVAHMRENYIKWEVGSDDIVERKHASCTPKDYKPYDFEKEPDDIAPMEIFGGSYVFRVNGTTHDETGAPNTSPKNADKFIRHYKEKFTKNLDDITICKQFGMEDADYAIITFGCSTRSAHAAMKLARNSGQKVGLVQLVTVWPFPDKLIEHICAQVKGIVVPEMNLGQLIREIRRVNKNAIPIMGVNRVDGNIITPGEILTVLREVQK